MLTEVVRYDITLHAFYAFQSGIPVIYSGDEIGQVNDYSYKDDPDKAVDSRYLHKRRNSTGHLLQTEISQIRLQGKLFHALDHLEHIRSSHSVFDATADLRTNRYLGFFYPCNRTRKCRGEIHPESITSAIRIKVAWINEDDGIYTDLISGHEMEAKRCYDSCIWMLLAVQKK